MIQRDYDILTLAGNRLGTISSITASTALRDWNEKNTEQGSTTAMTWERLRAKYCPFCARRLSSSNHRCTES